MDRRDFHKLTLAAMGGLVAGTSMACSKKEEEGKKEEKEGGKEEKAKVEKHVCRGLNSCKGNGITAKNECAGQGQCATYDHHSCAGENACKGQGGCGDKPALNDCKGEGKCAVPLMDHAWDIARARFEKEMKEKEKEFGDAPPKRAPEPNMESPKTEGDS